MNPIALSQEIPFAPKASFWERASDRINPILVREVQQFLKGRVFLVTVLLALVAIVLSGLYSISLYYDDAKHPVLGLEMFSLYARVLAFCALLAIPIHIFTSMRREVSSQTIELLLLSRMTPYQIVLGKLAASFVFFLLYLALFAPAMALTFLLHGVDVPLVALTLFLLTLQCTAWSVFGLFLGSLSRWRWVEIFLSACFVIGLFLYASSIGAMHGIKAAHEIHKWMHNPDFWIHFVVLVVGFVMVNAFFVMLAASTLTHPYENRSTPFRVFVMVIWLVANILAVLFIPDLRRNPESALYLELLIVAGSCPFLFFFATEEEKLSPRTHAHVPRSRLWAVLSTPFQPGGGRGLWFTVMSTSVILGSAGLLYVLFHQPHSMQALGDLGLYQERHSTLFNGWKNFFCAALLYAFFYTGLAALIRRGFGPGTRNNGWARLVTFVVMGVGILFSMVAAWFQKSSWAQASLFDLGNPFVVLRHLLQIRYYTDHPSFPPVNDTNNLHLVWGLGIMTLLVWVANGPLLIRSFREILAASAAHRGKQVSQ